MEVRDPLYGLIEYDETEEKIINSALLQRLRNIKQLAMASSVYPGAHHTRFEHCIGAMHLAGKVARKLELSEPDQRILRLAGLLHDIGHGPFSHVSEQVMEEHAKTLVDKYEADSAHEMMSMILVGKLGQLARVNLGDDAVEGIIGLLKKQKTRSVKKDIISGPLDVDKLDYLRRDSYFAGVKYGEFDLDKVMNSLVQIEVGSEEKHLGVNEEGIHAVEQLLLAKYHMNVQVYQHRVRRITDAMLVRGIKCALAEGIGEVKKLFDVEASDGYVKRYLANDDHTLMDLILTKGKRESRDYFARLCERRLLKEVYSIKIDESQFTDAVELRSIMTLTSQQMREIETRAADIFSYQDNIIPVNSVIADRQNVRNPTFKSPRIQIDTQTIMLKLKSGQRKSFRELSTVFNNPSIGPDTEILHIYLPLDGITDKEERDRLIEERKERMTNAIREVIK